MGKKSKFKLNFVYKVYANQIYMILHKFFGML